MSGDEALLWFTVMVSYAVASPIVSSNAAQKFGFISKLNFVGVCSRWSSFERHIIMENEHIMAYTMSASPTTILGCIVGSIHWLRVA